MAQMCARILVERYGARRVWLFGSLLPGHVLHRESDIDLAVEGLPSNQYFPALARLWDVLADANCELPFALDLVPLEDAQPSLVNFIHTEGKLLYEQSQL